MIQIPSEIHEKFFKTFPEALEEVLKEFAMQFEAQCLKFPWEIKEKAFKTFPQAFEGVLKEFAMQFEAQCLEIPWEIREKAFFMTQGAFTWFHMVFSSSTWDFTWNLL